jgi:hypothetical protein
MTIRKACALAGVAAILGIPAAASADMTFTFDTLVTGDAPSGDAPWATLLCEDTDTDEVTFTLTFNANAENDDEFVSSLYLNFDGTLPGDLLFSSSDTDAVVDLFTASQDGVNAAGGHSFDIGIDFNTSNDNGGADRLVAGEAYTFVLTGTSLSCESFESFSNVNEGDGVLAMLHIQGIDGELSGHVAAVPEPASMAALALGALGVLARRRRSRS